MIALISAGSCSSAFAKKSDKAEPAAKSSEPEPKPAAKPESKPEPAKAEIKSKTYTFGALDIEGRLKTPQLLYFLSRMKSEFDSASPQHRSFMPELKRSAREM